MNHLAHTLKNALKRHGQYLTDYYTGAKYKVVFKRLDVSNNEENNSKIIYYENTTPIQENTIIEYNNAYYIVKNQECDESNTMLSSTLIQCNVVIPINYNNHIINVPFVCVDESMKITTETNANINVVNGFAYIETGYNEYSNALWNQNYLNALNGWWSIKNKIVLNNKINFFLERELNPADNDYHVGHTNETTEFSMDDYNTNLEFYSYVTINSENIPISDALTYTSSDETIATVNSAGLITFVAAGEVTITATDSVHNSTDSVTITITASVPQITADVICNKPTWATNDNKNIRMGKTYIFTTVLTDKDENTVPLPENPTWTYASTITDPDDGTVYDMAQYVKDGKLNLTYGEDGTFTINFTSCKELIGCPWSFTTTVNVNGTDITYTQNTTIIKMY